MRDAEYFTWRAQNPLAHYYYLLARRDGELRGYLVAHRTRVDALDGETPTTIVECEAADDDVWADLVSTSLRVLPGSVVLLWVRDLGAGRNAHLDALPFVRHAPTGRPTRDVALPNLLVKPTGAGAGPLVSTASLHDPDSWDLRAVCGRSWR